MTYSPYPKGTVLLKAKRETLVLLASVAAMTFAVSYVVHKRPIAEQASVPVQHQVWAGQLSDVSTDTAVVKQAEPMTSASLVVPTSAVALPAPQTPPRAIPAPTVKPAKPCEGAACTIKAGGPSKQVATLAPVNGPTPNQTLGATTKANRKESLSLLTKLNPMNHLPDAVRHPVDYANDTFSGWMKRL